MRGFKFLPAGKRVVEQLLATQSDQLPPEEMQRLFCKEMANIDNPNSLRSPNIALFHNRNAKCSHCYDSFCFYRTLLT